MRFQRTASSHPYRAAIIAMTVFSLFLGIFVGLFVGLSFNLSPAFLDVVAAYPWVMLVAGLVSLAVCAPFAIRGIPGTFFKVYFFVAIVQVHLFSDM